MSQRRLSDFADVGYFANWGDLWYPRLANLMLGPVAKLTWVTPNHVSVASLVLAFVGGAFVLGGPAYYVWAALSFVMSYVLDCLDGQLARYTERFSDIGAWLDRTFDTFRIGLITGTFGYVTARSTGDDIYWLLAFVIIFAFMNRYYVKYVTMFEAIGKDKDYLDHSRTARQEVTASLDRQKSNRRTLTDHLRWLWGRNQTLFIFEEAEFVTFGALALLLNRLDLWLWTFGVIQVIILLQRLVTRGYMLGRKFERLYRPLMK